MDKQRFRIDKNEKLIALLEKRPYTIINYASNASYYPQTPQNIMGKPVVADAVPRDGEMLTYDVVSKEWKAQKPTDGNDIQLSYDVDGNVETVSTYQNGTLVILTTLTWVDSKVTTIVKEDYQKDKTETIDLIYSGDDVIQILKEIS